MIKQTCKASVGDHLYKHITSQSFVPETIVGMLKLRSDHEVLEVVNRLEEAIHVCRRKRQLRSRSMHKRVPRHTFSCGATYYHHYLMSMFDGRASWGNLVRDFMLVDLDHHEFLASRAEILLVTLHRHFPNLPQSLLDRLKIQYNKVFLTTMSSLSLKYDNACIVLRQYKYCLFLYEVNNPMIFFECSFHTKQ